MTWEQAKDKLFSMRFDTNSRPDRAIESGVWIVKGKTYPVMRYSYEFEIDGFEGEVSWGYVKQLNLVTYKKAMIRNEKERVVCIRDFIRNGKELHVQN